MQLPRPCDSCGSTESYGFREKMKEGSLLCADCTHISTSNLYQYMPAFKKDREKHAKDVIQPYTWKPRQGVIPNPNFVKVYGKQKFAAFNKANIDKGMAEIKAQAAKAATTGKLPTA